MLFACGNKEDNQSIKGLIASKNVKGLQDKKTALQAQIAEIEAGLATLDVKKEEALVSVLTSKVTLIP